MKRFIVRTPMTLEESDAVFKAHLLTFADVDEYKLKILSGDCVVQKPDGSPLLRLVKHALDAPLVKRSYDVVRAVKGDPSNRPEIFGRGASMRRIRIDGELSPRVATPREVTAYVGGRADLVGFYKYRKNAVTGAPPCRATGWTRKKPLLLSLLAPLVVAVDEVYRVELPVAYARQKAYMDSVADQWRLGNTVFSTLYAIKNLPTACHRDGFDFTGGFGVMSTFGDFDGGALVFPRYRVGVNYQPGDVLLADVHELHGNLPLITGERVTAVFFARSGMDKCP
jgi:hypothetical protein